jgi:hypothetical protein
MMMKKTNEELLHDIRMAGHAIDAHWPDAVPLVGQVDLEALRFLEGNARTLAIYCKLLGDRLDVGPSAAVDHLRASLEGE